MNFEYLIDEIERSQSESTVNVIEAMVDYNDKMDVIQECVNDNPDMFSDYFQEGAIDNVKMRGKSDSNKLVTAIKFLPRLIMELIRQAKLKLKRHPEKLSKNQVDHIHRICDECVKNVETRNKVDKKLEKRGMKIVKVVGGAAAGLIIGYKLTKQIHKQLDTVNSKDVIEYNKLEEKKAAMKKKFEEENKTYKKSPDKYDGEWWIGLENNKLMVEISHRNSYFSAVERYIKNPKEFDEALKDGNSGFWFNLPIENSHKSRVEFKDGYKSYVNDLERSIDILSKLDVIIKHALEVDNANIYKGAQSMWRQIGWIVEEVAAFLDACDILIAEGTISKEDASTVSAEDKESWRETLKDKGMTVKDGEIFYAKGDKGDK